MIVSCASYFGSGSSAVTDYLSEFDSVCSVAGNEFRFLHDPDGVSDLEYNLVENHHRLNSGRALKRYRQLVDFQAGNRLFKRYSPYFSNRWKEISYRYIDALTDFTYRGWGLSDVRDRRSLRFIGSRLINKLLHLTLWRNDPEREWSLPGKETVYCSRPSEARFLASTRAYVDELAEAANPEGKPIVSFDQLVPPSNLDRYLRYADNLYVIIVDRDPRDVYLLSKYRWNDSVVPRESIETFCRWYAYRRAHRETEHLDPARVLLLQFEDLIYAYEETAARLNAFLSLDAAQHTRKKSALDPEKSIKNTRLWTQYPQEADNIRYIAEALPAYLYTE